MKKHNGMRPLDILILLKILLLEGQTFYLRDISRNLYISNQRLQNL